MYYKGKISKVQEIEDSVTVIAGNYGASRVSDEMIDNNEYILFTVLVDSNEYDVITKGELYNLIRKYKNYFVCYVNQQEEIIFEKITDKSGKSFGKEIITGYIFPLGIDNGGYIVKYGRIPNDTTAKYYDRRIYVKRKDTVFSSDSIIKNSSFLRFSYSDTVDDYYYITIRVRKNNDVMDFIENFIDKRSVDEVTEKEVKEYLRKHSLFHKKKFIERLENFYKKNNFKRKIEIEEVKEVQPKELASQDKLTIIMENIEYMLSKIKMIDIKLYNKYQGKYEELLKSEEDTIHLTPFDYKSFILLEADIELTLSVLKRNTSTIMDYLNSLKKDYLDNLLNKSDSKTDITIGEIDKINEIFLKGKDNYSILDQRKILKEFAFIYLLELLENKDNEYNLDNSYFKMHLKTIMMYINTFIELGIVKSNILIDLEDEISFDSVLKIIDSLEVSNNFEKEGVLKLIK